jgi:hypothetical protein
MTLNKSTYFFAIILMLMVTTFLPLVYHNLPAFLRSHEKVWVPVWIVSLILFKPSVFKGKNLQAVIAFYAIMLLIMTRILWYNVSPWNIAILREEFLTFTIAMSVYYYFVNDSNYIGLARLSKWVLIFMVITAIMSIYTSILMPNFGRLMFHQSFMWTRKFGYGGYGYVGAVVALFPLLVYYFRNVNKSIFSRPMLVGFILVCFVALLRIQIFANVLLGALVLVFAILGRKKLNVSILVAMVSILFFLIIPKTFYSDLLFGVTKYFDPSSDIYFKINDLALFTEQGYGDLTGVEARTARYPILFDLFLSNPLLGYSFTDFQGEQAGIGHIYWINKLAVYGLVGFIPFVILFYRIINENMRRFDTEYKYYYLVSVFGIIALGMMKALAGREMWYFVLIFTTGMYYLPLLKKDASKQKVARSEIENIPFGS